MKDKVALIALLVLSVGLVTYMNYLAPTEDISVEDVTDLECGFTSHFQSWLNKHDGILVANSEYGSMHFDRSDLKCGAFGGKSDSNETLKKHPVIFIHGNSDIGFGRGSQDGYVSWQTGFRSLANFLSQNGYKKSEMYTTTWGPANPNMAQNNYHSKDTVMRMRKFVEAVLAYTKAKKVVVIGHSMGVSIARRVLKGGNAIDHSAGTYNVGESLKDKVEVFIGLAGASLGLVACQFSSVMPTCGTKDGFFPGTLPTSGPSTYLNQINTDSNTEADKVYTIWSKNDDLIMYQCLVWGKVTCRIPNQAAEVVKTGLEWGHFAVRDNTGPDLIGWLKKSENQE